jgi:hypothetical protein
MKKRLVLEEKICEKIQKYIEEENIKINLLLLFSDNLKININKINTIKLIKDFTEEFKKYIMARRNKEYSSFEEFCKSNKDFLICQYLEDEPIVELYSKKPEVNKVDVDYLSLTDEKKLTHIINKKIEKMALCREKIDKIYLLIITSPDPPNLVPFLDDDIGKVREILNLYTKGENHFDKIFLYHHRDIEPKIIKSD